MPTGGMSLGHEFYCPESWPGCRFVTVFWLGSLDQSGAWMPAPPWLPVRLVGELLLVSC